MKILVSSSWNQLFAHGVTFLFFQCQFAVVLGIDIVHGLDEGLYLVKWKKTRGKHCGKDCVRETRQIESANLP